ncbi:hypothetical protein [Vibrio sp. M260118]|uniref:hypothetical protein n=1 Tax=Vibrio sp. M260118 TaxID=3020896 RepID=UPI002F41510E
MDTEAKLEKAIVEAVKTTNSQIPLLPAEEREDKEKEVVILINQLTTLLQGESSATTEEQQAALDAVKGLTQQAKEAEGDIVKIIEALNRLSDAIEKVEKVASKVAPIVALV